MVDDSTGDFLANRVGHGVSAALHPAGRGSGVELHLLPSTLGGHGRSAVARLASWEEAHEPSAHDAEAGAAPLPRGQRLYHANEVVCVARGPLIDDRKDLRQVRRDERCSVWLGVTR